MMWGDKVFWQYREHLVLEMFGNSCLWSECLLPQQSFFLKYIFNNASAVSSLNLSAFCPICASMIQSLELLLQRPSWSITLQFLLNQICPACTAKCFFLMLRYGKIIFFCWMMVRSDQQNTGLRINVCLSLQIWCKSV